MSLIRDEISPSGLSGPLRTVDARIVRGCPLVGVASADPFKSLSNKLKLLVVEVKLLPANQITCLTRVATFLAKIKFPVFSPEFSLCYRNFPCVIFMQKTNN